MQRVLIIGASGGIGIEAVRLALQAGHRVRALARNTERIGIDHPNLETRSADATDAEAVRATLEGVDAVIQVIGVAPSLRRMFTPIEVFSKTTAVLVAEMERAGVRRLVAVTGFGAATAARPSAWPNALATGCSSATPMTTRTARR